MKEASMAHATESAAREKNGPRNKPNKLQACSTQHADTSRKRPGGGLDTRDTRGFGATVGRAGQASAKAIGAATEQRHPLFPKSASPQESGRAWSCTRRSCLLRPDALCWRTHAKTAYTCYTTHMLH